MTSSLGHEAIGWERESPSHHLKVAVIREEFVTLTGDPLIAVVLNQLLYWTQRVKDFDLLLEEERSFHPDCNVSPRHGWIYKSADELSDETMLCTTRPTMRKYLKFLVDQGWIDERRNLHNKWNKTTEYRLNLRKLQQDLFSLGYALPGYPLLLTRQEKNDSPELLEEQNVQKSTANENGEHSKERKLPSMLKNFPSKEKNLTSYTYTEITHKNTSKERHARESASLMLDLWKQHIGQDQIPLTEARQRHLDSLLALHFHGDINLWKQFCLRVKSSPFLMGEGRRKWQVTLEWILSKENLLKILKGNFDDPEHIEYERNEGSRTLQGMGTHETLASIEDPVWKNWCAQLLGMNPATGGLLMHGGVPVKAVLLSSDVKQIAKARFKEFDGRLVWIECATHHVQNRIDDLRLKFLAVVQATYPNARSIRTHLNPHSFQQSTLLEGEVNDVE